jgi:hypothetical protein
MTNHVYAKILRVIDTLICLTDCRDDTLTYYVRVYLSYRNQYPLETDLILGDLSRSEITKLHSVTQEFILTTKQKE